jgi:hypothetical protein
LPFPFVAFAVARRAAAFAQPVSCSQRRDVVNASHKDPERISTGITSGKLQTLAFHFIRQDRKTCQVLLSFEPKAGKTYLMRNVADSEGCRSELLDITNPDAAKAEPSRMHREPTGFLQADNACKPLTSTLPDSARKGVDARANPLEGFRDLLPGR